MFRFLHFLLVYFLYYYIVLKGIDLSHWQGNVDFARIKASGVKFVYVKATQSTTFTDPTFATNVKNARDAGIPIGAYHYAKPTAPLNLTEAKNQATFFVNTMKNSGYSYLVTRDGVSVYSGTNTSFTDNTVSPKTTYAAYHSGNRAKVTVTVKTNEGKVVSSAKVTMTIKSPSGSVTTMTGKTDASANFISLYTTAKKPIGTYIVTAKTMLNGVDLPIATCTFKTVY
jgi:hypothetical protein